MSAVVNPVLLGLPPPFDRDLHFFDFEDEWSAERADAALQVVEQLTRMYLAGYPVVEVAMFEGRDRQLRYAIEDLVPSFHDLANAASCILPKLDPSVGTTATELENFAVKYSQGCAYFALYQAGNWLARNPAPRADWPGTARFLAIAEESWRQVPEEIGIILAIDAAQAGQDQARRLLRAVMDDETAPQSMRSDADLLWSRIVNPMAPLDDIATATGSEDGAWSPEAEAAIITLEEYAEVYEALLSVRSAEASGSRSGSLDDHARVAEAKARLGAVRHAAGDPALSPIEDAERETLAAFMAEAQRVVAKRLETAEAQADAIAPDDPALLAWFETLRARPPENEARWADARSEFAARFPTILARHPDLKTLSEANHNARSALIREAGRADIDAIVALQDAFSRDARLAFVVPGLREATLTRLRVPGGSPLAQAVAHQHASLAQDEAFAHLAEVAIGKARALAIRGGSGLALFGRAALPTGGWEQASIHAQVGDADMDPRFDGVLNLEGGDLEEFWAAINVAHLIKDRATFAISSGDLALAARRVAHGELDREALENALVIFLDDVVFDPEFFGCCVLEAADAAARDRQLRIESAELLRDAARLSPSLHPLECLGLARLPSEVARRIIEALHARPAQLGAVGRLAREPVAARGVARLAEALEGPEVLARLVSHRNSEAIADTVRRLGAADGSLAKRITESLGQGPASTRALRLIHEVKLNTPLTGAACFYLTEELNVKISHDPCLRDRDVEVRYENRRGRMVNIEVSIGPEATRADVLPHAPAVEDLQRYWNLKGMLHVVLAMSRLRLGSRSFIPDTEGYEALQEIEKLEETLSHASWFPRSALPERTAILERELSAQIDLFARLSVFTGPGSILGFRRGRRGPDYQG